MADPVRQQGYKATRLTAEARAMAADILDTPEYKESVMERIRLHTLPPAVEVLLLHYRFGRPSMKVEHAAADIHDEMAEATEEQLAAFAREAATELEKVAALRRVKQLEAEARKEKEQEPNLGRLLRREEEIEKVKSSVH